MKEKSMQLQTTKAHLFADVQVDYCSCTCMKAFLSLTYSLQLQVVQLSESVQICNRIAGISTRSQTLPSMQPATPDSKWTIEMSNAMQPFCLPTPYPQRKVINHDLAIFSSAVSFNAATRTRCEPRAA